MFLQQFPARAALPVMPPREMAVIGMAQGRMRPLATCLRGAVLCLGNFDGLHLGHRSLLAHARQIARHEDRPLALMSCEPHPRSFFAPAQHERFRLATPVQKRMLVSATSCSYLFEPTFDTAFAGLAAEAFLETVLLGGLGIGAIVCGTDFRFGAGRKGDTAMIEDFCRDRGLVARIVDKTVPASSSGIRAALAERNLAEVRRQLGRHWQMDLGMTGVQMRPPAGRYQARSLAHGHVLDLTIQADGDCTVDAARHGRFLDLVAAL